MAKLKSSKILAGFLAFVMIVSMLPISIYTTVFAAGIDSYSVQLTDGTDVLDLDDIEITMTNKADESITATVKTVDGVAVFENFVEEEATYIVSVAEAFGYETVAASEITVAVDEVSTNVALTALTKVNISGIVTDENGDAYEGAKVEISGYVTIETTTDAEGKYAFETYAGKENIINISAKEEDKQYNAIPGKATYNADVVDANYQFSVKTFNIDTTSGENGTITDDEADIPYGEDRSVTITANTGYRIKEILLDNQPVDGVKDKTEHVVELNAIDKNHSISVSFYKATYTVSFDVSTNGKVEYNTDDVALGGQITNVTVEENGSVDFEAIANAENGYHVEKVTIGGDVKLADGNNDDKKFAGTVTSDEINTTVNVTVVFAINEYKVTVGTVENGKVVLDDEIGNNSETELIIKHGENVYIQVVPNEHYELSEITVGGSPVDFMETVNVYETLGVNITSDVSVNVVLVEKDAANADSYVMTLPEANNTVSGVTYVADGAKVTFAPAGEYKRVKVTYIQNGKQKSETGSSGETVEIVLGENGVDKIVSVAASKNERRGQWDEAAALNITYDAVLPTISEVQNSGKWFKTATKYSFTVEDANAGVKEVKYAATNDISTATIINEEDGTYSFNVSAEFNGNYYIWVTDYCGNTLETTADVKIDLTAPTIIGFTFSTQENSIVADLINFASFGTICKEKMYLTVSAADDNISSGYKTIALYYGNTLLEVKDVSAGANAVTFELTEEKFHERTKIYAVVIDVAGNESVETSPMDAGVTNNQESIKSDFVQIATDKPTVVITPDAPVHTAGGKDWYNGNVNFNVAVKDTVSGIKFVEIKINGQIIETDLNNTNLTQDFSKGATPVMEKAFTVSTSQNALDGKNTIEVVVTSTAGQKSVVYSDEVYIDTTDANIVGYEITTINDDPLSNVLNFLTFGIFYNKQVKITVTAEDVNASAGVKNITLYLGENDYTQSVENNKATFTVTASELSANAVFAADISAIATDFVNNATPNAVIPTEVNSNIKDSSLMLENVDPTATIVPNTPAVADKNEATKDDNNWYANDVEFTVTTGDVNSGIREVVITINDTEVVKEIFYNDDATDTEIHEKIYTVATDDAGVTRAQNGSYTVVATVTDNAGNVFTTEEYVVYKDIDDPFITNFDFQATDYVEENESVVDENDEALVVTTDYGFYFKADTNVIITAKDVAPTAGIKSITYYTVDFTNNAEGVKSEEKTVLVNENNQITITIPANFKGQIYAKATDNVLNVTDKFANPNSAIVETQDKHDAATYDHIVFEKDSTSYTANDGTELYANDVDVTITVEDIYSGIREIEWSVVAPYDTDNNQNGKVTLKNDKSVVEGTETDWTQVETDINLVTKMQKTIKVKNNSNNIIVTVKMTDRAGNTTTDKIEFSIDKIDPNITIVYGNDEVHDAENTDFFSTKRTATITVTERNFRASDVVFAITNTDKTIPTVDLKDAATWTTTADSVDPDKTIHVATIKYEVDGDYTFDISYKDNAERPANTIETHKFTIDMTMPEVTVVYDNNSALNGNYYKADRIATITIKEHNFDSSRVNVIGVATDNGAASTFPATSTWKDNGNDTYTATISYTADSKYSFDIEFRDKANNSITDYTPEEFYVDKTAPNLSITGVADKSANNGDVAPVVTYSDTNFNKDAVTITLSGINNGKDLKYTGSYANIANGQTYTYANFEKVQSVDDIYTLTAKLTDMAGNETEATITFSANRFGSVYNLTGLEDILTKYLQTEEDIVFTETNVDSLEREGIKIKLTKNGTPSDLVEGTDYTVEVTGGNGEWSVYTYTIKKALFADDGRYSIAIYSKDAAGNVNENIDETKAAEISFGIDKTNPVIVPIDLESGVQYAVDMKTVSIEIKDNLVLEGVKIYLNGKEVEYTVNGETYTFDIPKSNSKQDVKIVAIDAAGNEEPVEITDFLVNANIFVRWFNNTPLFVGSIIGVVVLALGITGFAVFGKKKKEEEK